MSLENVQTPEMTQQQRDALAERIAAVLRERKKIGAERRMHQRRNSQGILARHHVSPVVVSTSSESIQDGYACE